MKQAKAFLTWLKEDYLSEEKILTDYEEYLTKQREELKQYFINRMQTELSPCNNCTSYATCHRDHSKICQKAAQFNDTARSLADDFINQTESIKQHN